QDVFINKFDFAVLIGLVAQGLFTMRFLVQWLASEKAGRSVMPFSFWLFSVGGGLLLFAYSLWRRDLVFILGQGFGVFVYLRNVALVLKERREKAGKMEQVS
ncbi:MAG: lipid-A-disaccharide synthase N-terminal domain-containing protein, partial [Hyphomicrobiales bacterium]|nr:lipid-A-disaccharide synthase N-terminal domain-containing protein [Hyphomicrobiales bacterium]